MSILGTIAGMVFGKRKMSVTNIRRGGSAASSVGRARKQAQDVGRAEDKIEDLEAVIAELQQEMEAEIAELNEKFNPQSLEIEVEQVKPYKKDIDIVAVSLLWVPFDERETAMI